MTHVTIGQVEMMLAALGAAFIIWFVVAVTLKFANDPNAEQNGEKVLVGLLTLACSLVLAVFLHGAQ
jgi:hypothetical protein